jgi:hypothetical protein
VRRKAEQEHLQKQKLQKQTGGSRSNDGGLNEPAPGTPRDSGEHAAVQSPEQALLSLLQLACGSYESALDVLGRSLARAGVDRLPRSASAVVAFVRGHVLQVLKDEVGPRLATALRDDLVAALGEQLPTAERITIPPSSVARAVQPAHPASVPRGAGTPLDVALVDADCVGRAALARALVRERWNVTVVDSEEPPDGAPDPLDVALVDAAHPAAQAVLESIVRSHPGLAVVVRTGDGGKTRAELALLPVGRIELTSADASPHELVKAIRRATGT